MSKKGNGHAEPELSHEEAKENVRAENVGKELLVELVDRIKTLDKPWAQTSEDEQNDVIDALRDNVHLLVKRAIAAIEATDRPHFIATLEQVVFKSGVKIVLKGAPGAAAHALADRTGLEVYVVVGDAQRFMAGAEEVKGDPDQPQLGIEQADELGAEA